MDRSAAIANEFLRKAEGAALTQMQLQKLVYFAHGWTLALTGRPLTSDQPEAWDFGPVYRDLYDHTKFFGRNPIGREITPDDDEAIRFFLNSPSGEKAYQAKLSITEAAIVGHVWSRYGELSGARLSALTHQADTPWTKTYKDGSGKNRQISNDLVQDHYSKIASSAQLAD